MKKQSTRIAGVRIVFKHPNNDLHDRDRFLIAHLMSMGVISDTFNGEGWWIISKYNL
jgi:hypothetical protein